MIIDCFGTLIETGNISEGFENKKSYDLASKINQTDGKELKIGISLRPLIYDFLDSLIQEF